MRQTPDCTHCPVRVLPKAPGRLGRPPQRGLRAREAPAGRAGRLLGQSPARAPSTNVAVGACAWRDRAPASPPGWRVAWEGDTTGRGGPHLPRRDGDDARLRLRLPARGHSLASRARSEYIPSSGGPGRRGGPRAGPGTRPRPPRPSLAATSSCPRREEPPPPARPRQRRERRRLGGRRGAGRGASLVPWPNGDGSGGPVRGGPAPRRAAAGERCARRQLGGVRPARRAGGRGPPLRALASQLAPQGARPGSSSSPGPAPRQRKRTADLGGQRRRPDGGFPTGRAEGCDRRRCLRSDPGRGGPGPPSDLGLVVSCLVGPIFSFMAFLVPSAGSQARLLLHKQAGKERQAKVLGNEKRASEKEPRGPFCVTVVPPQYLTRNWWSDRVTSMAQARPSVNNCLLHTVSPVTCLVWVCTRRLNPRCGPVQAGLTFGSALGFAILQEVQYVETPKYT